MCSIVTGESTLTTGYFYLKKAALQQGRKMMHSFLEAGSHPDSAFMNHFSHYELTNYSIYIFYVIRSCCECYLAVFHMSHFLSLFVKLLCFPVCFELTTRDDCFQLTPTLYHCATEDYRHELLVLFLYLHLHRFFKF